MTHAEFTHLTPRAQVQTITHQGLYLTQRWDDEAPVYLYHLPGEGKGFFVEVGYEPGTPRMVVQRSFLSTRLLDAYLPQWRLPAR